MKSNIKFFAFITSGLPIRNEFMAVTAINLYQFNLVIRIYFSLLNLLQYLMLPSSLKNIHLKKYWFHLVKHTIHH